MLSICCKNIHYFVKHGAMIIFKRLRMMQGLGLKAASWYLCYSIEYVGCLVTVFRTVLDFNLKYTLHGTFNWELQTVTTFHGLLDSYHDAIWTIVHKRGRNICQPSFEEHAIDVLQHSASSKRCRNGGWSVHRIGWQTGSALRQRARATRNSSVGPHS